MSDQAVRHDPATEPLQADKSLGELFGEFTSDLGLLLRQEVDLAKTETRQEMKRVARGAGMLAGAGLSAWIALLLLSFALAWWIDKALDTALSFLLVGLVWAIAAAVLAIRGKQQTAEARPLPQTVQTLKEDAQWIKAQTS